VPIRFYLDEHIAAGVALGLRRRNIEVTTAADAGMYGADDASQLAFAASSGRVLVTQDADFLRLHADGAAHAGIVYCRQGTVTLGAMLRRLVLISDLLSPEEIAGRVEFI